MVLKNEVKNLFTTYYFFNTVIIINMRKYLIFSLFLILVSCDSGSNLDTDEVCFPMVDSPNFDLNDLDNFNLIESRRQPNNEELQIISETYDCLQDLDLITPEQNSCLMDDIENIKVVVIEGTGNRLNRIGNIDTFICGDVELFPGGGCLRNDTMVLEESEIAFSIFNSSCIRASHLTIPMPVDINNHPFFVSSSGGIPDCRCFPTGLNF